MCRPSRSTRRVGVGGGGWTTLALLSVAVVQLGTVHAQLAEGDSCVLAARPGTCRLLRACAPLWGLVQRAGRPMPQRVRDVLIAASCGYSGAEPIVCCLPTASPVTTAPETPTPTPTPGRRTPTDVRGHTNLRLLPADCGTIEDERITGGNRTGPFEFPWMVLIAYNTARGRRTSCGATLVSSRYALTAAHCVSHLGARMSLAGVVVGEHDLRTDPDCERNEGRLQCKDNARNITIEQAIPHPGYSPSSLHDDITLIRLAEPEYESEYSCFQNITIEQAIPHPGYSPSSLHDDIALIRLAEHIDLSGDSVKAICLPNTPELQRTDLSALHVAVAGWGATEDGLQSPVLLKVDLPIVPNSRCQQVYNGSAVIDERQMCAGGVAEKDSCGGDSGGPLMYPGQLATGDVSYVQHGVVSFGHRTCGAGGYPGVYTRVAYYMDWILDNMRD